MNEPVNVNLTLIPCENCGRKFANDRLEVHSRACKQRVAINPKVQTQVNKTSNEEFMKKLEKELKSSSTAGSLNSTGKPLALICYLCGKEFGTNSLEIHLKTCKTTYTKDNNDDPDDLRPETLDYILQLVKNKKNLDSEILNKYNSEAERKYKEKNFIPCANCGRKFLSDRLEVHKKGCKTKIDNSRARSKSPAKTVNLRNSAEIFSSTKLFEEKLAKQNITSKQSSTQSSSFVSNGNKPLFLVCFICGREFGKHSLDFHLKSCAEKNTEPNKKRVTPKELTTILAKLSRGEDISNSEIVECNKVAEEIHKTQTMKKCPGCNRRFNPDRLEVHLRSCKKGAENMNRSVSPKMISRPRMHMCPLCGREFGSASLPIHMKTCKDKFELEQESLPKHQRKSAESIIAKYNQANIALKSGGNYNIDKANDDAYKIWSNEALVACEMCARTFLPDRLNVHIRSCKGPSAKKK